MPSPPGFALSSGVPLVNPPAKTQAAFVGKLYKMLEDPDIARTGLIRWSPDGRIFTCPNPTEFSKTILPQFFKHNNWQSFVRQLNMYAFNKVNDLQATTSDPQAWEFRHPLFRRGEPHLLASIKRKSTRPNASDTTHSPPEDDGKGGIAGWMSDAPFVSSPPHERERENERERDRERVRAEVYGMNMQTGEMVTARL
ncbi:HSF-type DNA-binding-domain-containing protein, partial [Naematelia encephala]